MLRRCHGPMSAMRISTNLWLGRGSPVHFCLSCKHPVVLLPRPTTFQSQTNTLTCTGISPLVVLETGYLQIKSRVEEPGGDCWWCAFPSACSGGGGGLTIRLSWTPASDTISHVLRIKWRSQYHSKINCVMGLCFLYYIYMWCGDLLIVCVFWHLIFFHKINYGKP